MNTTVSMLFLLVSMFLTPVAVAQIATVAPAATPTPTRVAPLLDALQSDVEAFWTAETTSPLVGETFILTLTMLANPGVEITGWPVLPSNADTLEVIESGEAIISPVDGRMQYTQQVRARLWKVGAYTTPEIVVVYTSNGIERAAPVQSATITVLSVLATTTDSSLRPAIAPRDIDSLSPWWSIVVATVIGGAVAIVWQFVIMRLNNRQASPEGQALSAMAQLEDLTDQRLSPEILYPLIADILRRYVSERFGISAMEMTTTELLDMLRSSDIPRDSRLQLQWLLNQADLVKFAGFTPENVHIQRTISAAVRWVKQMDSLPREEVAKGEAIA